MSLVRYEPWGLFNQLSRELGHRHHHAAEQTKNERAAASHDWTPAVDIKETDTAFHIVADVPGVDPKDIEIHMENGTLTIKGERESKKEDTKEGYKRVERSYGSFYRSFNMPDTADAEKIAAKSHNGVLEVTIPKQEKVQARKIEVQH